MYCTLFKSRLSTLAGDLGRAMVVEQNQGVKGRFDLRSSPQMPRSPSPSRDERDRGRDKDRGRERRTGDSTDRKRRRSRSRSPADRKEKKYTL